MDAAGRQLPDEPRVHRPEGEPARIAVAQQPLELRRREVGIGHEAGALADQVERQLGTAVRRSAVLPHDRVRDRAAGRALPHDRRFALIGDRDRVRPFTPPKCFGGRDEHRLPDLLRVVLDPARPREVLRQLDVPAAANRQVVVDEEAGRARRPLVDGEDHAGEYCYLINSTAETLPSPCRNTSFTSPRPGANHDVRVPLPNGKPGCFSVLATTSARNVPAGTFTVCTPTTRDVPVTPYTEKSRPFGSDDHVAPVVGYAGMIGLKPNVIRSSGVRKCRRFATGSNFGPSGGNEASDAAFAALATLVTPESRVVNS